MKRTQHFRNFWTSLANWASMRAYGKPVIMLQGELDFERGKVAQVCLALENLRSRARCVWAEHGHTLDGKPKDTPEWTALQEALDGLD